MEKESAVPDDGDSTQPGQSWQLHFLGSVEAERGDGKRLPSEAFRNQKTTLLLAYLALEKPRVPKTRAALAPLFWFENGAANLRKALFRLRHLEGPSHPDADRTAINGSINLLDAIMLDSGDALIGRIDRFQTDVDAFRGAVQAANESHPAAAMTAVKWLERADALYRGPFLDGIRVETRVLSDWVVHTRQELARAHFGVLMTLAHRWEEQGDLVAALRFARRAAHCDVLTDGIDDATHLAALHLALRLAVACGEDGVALTLYQERNELDLDGLEALPDPALTAHLNRLLAEAETLRTRRRRPPRPDQDIGARLIHETLQRLPSEIARFYAALSIFPGRFTREQAAEVCRKPNATRLLEELTARSLVLVPASPSGVQAENADGAVRYRLPDAARPVAMKRLRPDQRARLARRLALHVSWQVQVAYYHPESRYMGGTRAVVFPDEQENIDAALSWMLAEGHDRWRGTQLLIHLLEHWATLGRCDDAIRWTEVALAYPGDADADLGERDEAALSGLLVERGPHIRYQLHLVAGKMWGSLGNPAAAVDSLRAAVEWARRCPFPTAVASTLHDLGAVYVHLEQDAEAERCFAEALPIAEKHGGWGGTIWLRMALAESLHLQGNIAAAREAYATCLEMHHEARRAFGIAGTQYRLGGLEMQTGNYLAARRHLGSALAHFRAVQEPNGMAECLWQIGQIDLDQGVWGEAEHHLEEATRLLESQNKEHTIAGVRATLGDLALRQGHWQQARSHYEAGLAFWRAKEHNRWTAAFLVRLADLALLEAPVKPTATATATELATEAMARCGDNWAARAVRTYAAARRILGECARREGRLDAARAHLETALRLQERAELRLEVARTQEALARLAEAASDSDGALSWWQSAEALREAMGTPRSPGESLTSSPTPLVGSPF